MDGMPAPAPIAGPVLRRAGGYAFDTWTGAAGLQCSFAYRRIEDAIRARRITAGQSGMVLCSTVDEFGALIDVARRQPTLARQAGEG